MTSKSRNTLVAVVIGVVVIAFAVRQMRKSAAKTREVVATITHIDLATRIASAEVTHPETGGAMEISGQVPPECEITINGQPAKLEDLRIRDRGKIRGRVEDDTPSKEGKPRKKVVPISIHITRTGETPVESRKIPTPTDADPSSVKPEPPETAKTSDG